MTTPESGHDFLPSQKELTTEQKKELTADIHSLKLPLIEIESAFSDIKRKYLPEDYRESQKGFYFEEMPDEKRKKLSEFTNGICSQLPKAINILFEIPNFHIPEVALPQSLFNGKMNSRIVRERIRQNDSEIINFVKLEAYIATLETIIGTMSSKGILENLPNKILNDQKDASIKIISDFYNTLNKIKEQIFQFIQENPMMV